MFHWSREVWTDVAILFALTMGISASWWIILKAWMEDLIKQRDSERPYSATIPPKSLKKSPNFVYYAHPYKGELRCEIVLRVRAGTRISKANMGIYAGLKPSDVHYKSVRGPIAVERLILEDPTGGFHIVPLIRKFFPHWEGL